MTKTFWREAACALLAGTLVLAHLSHGISPLDDGHYFWVAQRLNDGAALHGNVLSPHPGLIYYLDAALLHAFGLELLVLRYPLPIVSALLTWALVALARPAGAATQWGVGLAGSALGVVQFISPSASWYATAFAAITLFAFHQGSTTSGRHRLGWWLIAGVLLGLTAGMRQTHGAMAAAGIVFLHILAVQPRPVSPGKVEQAGSIVVVGLAICIVLLPAIGAATPSAWYLTLPAISCVALALARWWSFPSARTLAWTLPVGIGCTAAVLPLVLLFAFQGTLGELVTELIVRPSAFVHYSEIRGVSFLSLLTDASELISEPGWYPKANALFLLIVTLVPAFLMIQILSARDRLVTSGATPLVVLASTMTLHQISFQGILYVYFWLPAALATCLMLGERRWLKTALVSVACLSIFAALFHSGRLAGTGHWNVFTVTERSLIPCELPGCKLRIDPVSGRPLMENFREIIRTVDKNRPILILPVGASLYGHLPHDSPWSIGWTRNGMTTGEEYERLAEEVRARPTTVIAVDRNEGAELEKQGGISTVLSGHCKIASGQHFEYYAACGARTRSCSHVHASAEAQDPSLAVQSSCFSRSTRL